jgi:hypothetical protein
MRQAVDLALVILSLIAGTTSANNHIPPRNGVLKRDTQLSCPGHSYDILCAADSGPAICHERLDICCQLPDSKTPYSCAGLESPHCCGTDKPACGTDPTCKNIKGDREVVSALAVVYPTSSTVSATSSATATKINPFASGTQAAVVKLATITGEKNPHVTGGADSSRGWTKGNGALMVFAGAIALL